MAIAGIACRDDQHEAPGPAPSMQQRAKRPRRASPKPKPHPKQQPQPRRRGRKVNLLATQRTINKYRMTSCRYKNKINRLEEQIVDLKLQIASLKTRDGRNVSVREGMDIALRAAMSNQSGNSIGMGLKCDLHSKTCIRWETKLHASLIVFSRSAYLLCRELDYSEPEPSLCVHVVRHKAARLVCGEHLGNGSW